MKIFVCHKWQMFNHLQHNIKEKTMKNMILYYDVNEPIGIVPVRGMVVIGGDAPMWKFCNLFHKCVMEGAAVVATGIGVEKSTSRKDYTVAYSTSARYRIGDTIPIDLEEKDDIDLPEF
jgi:hypothetical protein